MVGAIASVAANPSIKRAWFGRLALLYGGATVNSARIRARG
jgi:hypothetical protein